MKIAIIGSGIAGNTLAYHLHREHEITLFEANDYVGGHTNTHDIHYDGRDYAIDTGFIVFNEKTYPNFIQMLNELNVPFHKTNMSFSVKCELSGLEYNGNNLNSLFAQRRNLFKPSFHRMIRDILRFNREAPAYTQQLAATTQVSLSLGDYLQKHNYSQEFIEHYIIPMGSAIWSSSHQQMMTFPAEFFIRFFLNHGLLSVNDRPDWFVIKGGSRQYLEKLTQGFHDRIRLNCPVKKVIRHQDHVEVFTDSIGRERFDYVFFACHSDQALKMIEAPTSTETEILGAFPYQSNEVILHTDSSLLPKRKLAWAAWNYHRTGNLVNPVAVTYDMNILQGIDSEHTFCVTLNNTQAIDESKIIKRLNYDHPLFTQGGIDAQSQQGKINGINRCFYAGAYWRNGFHEDGVVSALNAIEHFREVNCAQQDLRRAS